MNRETARDVVTISLFTLAGPVIGVVITTALRGGLVGMAAAFAAMILFIVISHPAGFIASMLVASAAGLCGGGCAIVIRRLGWPLAFAPAAIAGSCAGLGLFALALHVQLDAYPFFIAFIAAITCSLIDMLIWQSIPDPQGHATAVPAPAQTVTFASSRPALPNILR